MTEKNLAAHRENGRKSRGAATAAGKERARAANLRHGFYSRERDQALEALGERPEDLDNLIEAVREQFSPATAFEEYLAEGLARAWFRLQRAVRLQENLAVHRLESSQRHGEWMTSEVRRRFSLLREPLELLEAYASHPGFYTPRPLFRTFLEAFAKQRGLEGSNEEIFVLMHRLRRPERADSAPAGSGAAEGTAEVDVLVAEAIENGDLEEKAWLENEDDPVPRPGIPIAEGPEREALREQLEELVGQQFRALEAASEEMIREQTGSLTPLERDVVVARTGEEEVFLRRQEESCFRQAMRLGNFLAKMQDRAGKAEARDAGFGNTGPAPGGRGSGMGDGTSGIGNHSPVVGNNGRRARAGRGRARSAPRRSLQPAAAGWPSRPPAPTRLALPASSPALRRDSRRIRPPRGAGHPCLSSRFSFPNSRRPQRPRSVLPGWSLVTRRASLQY